MPNNALQSDTYNQAAFGYANPCPLASAAELRCYVASCRVARLSLCWPVRR